MSANLMKAAIVLQCGGALMLLAANWVMAGQGQTICLAAGLIMLAVWAKSEHWFDALLTLYFLGAFVLFSFLPIIGPL